MKLRHHKHPIRKHVVRLFILAVASVCLLSSFNFAQAADFAHDQTLTVAGTAAANRFGETVAATDTYLASGAPLDDTLGTDAGAVYIYEKVGGVWTYRQKISASDGAAGDQFGASLAINGTTLVVGAPYDDIGAATDAGSVYSFDLELGSWLQTEKLTMQTPVSFEKFGLAVDMTADRLVVGVPGYNGATSATTFGRGAVIVWDRQGINWGNEYAYNYTSPVTATRPAAFGYSVAISGDKIAAGAPRDFAATSGQGSNAGSMSVLAYDSDTSTWASEGRFYSTTPASSDYFGTSVDIQGNTLITANYAISATSPKIFTYTYSEGAWSAPTVIVPTGTSISRRYIGQSVEIAPDETSILVGSLITYVSTDYVGRVFVLKPNETTDVWEQSQVISSPDAPTSSGYFGNDVAYAGNTPLIASPMVTAAAGSRGAIYTYNAGDATPPTLTLSSGSPQYLKNPYTVTIDTSEPVTGFTQSDISISSGATLSNFTPVSSTQYTVLVTPSSDGQYTMSIAANAMQDAAGNGNTASPQLTRIHDTTAPAAAVLAPSQSTYFSSPTISASVRISDTNGGLSGLDASDISITNGTISDFSTSTNTNSITGDFTITPTAQGAITFSVNEAAVADQAGNASAASVTRTIYYDTGKPTPSFDTALNPTNVSPFEVTLLFDEPVADIDDVSEEQIGISGGTIDNFQSVSTQEYTFDVTPSEVGTVTLSYAADQVADQAGNTNIAATGYDIEYDNFGPEVTISAADSATNSSPIDFTVSLSESVDGLADDDFTVTNGTVTSFTQQSATSYTATVTPAANGDVAVSLPAQKATDGAGNGNQASNTATVDYDTVRPSVDITHEYDSPTNVSPLVFTINFSESVSDLDSSDITLTNASLDSLEKISAQEYTLSVIPTDGTVTVQVDANAVSDPATNQNTQGSTSLESDRTAPTGTVDALHTNNTRPGITGTISEPVDNIAVTIDGETFNASINNTARTWSVSGSLFGPLSDGIYDVTLVITDIAGNEGSDTTSDEVRIDTDQPIITITPERDETNQNPVLFNVSSSRDISGLEASDFTVTNGSVSSVSETDPQTYVVAVTPQTQGVVALQLQEGTVEDTAGNENPESNSAESRYDVTRPQITLSGTTTPIKNSFTVTADTTEPLQEFLASDVSVTNGSVTQVQQVTDQRYTLSIQPAAEGSVNVQIPADSTTDLAGNLNTASNTFSRIYDITPPDTPTVDNKTVTTRQPTLTGTFDSSNTAVLRITIGKHVYQSTAPNSPIETSGDNWELDFSKTEVRLEYGVYNVHAVAVDAANNSSIDTTNNELVINSPGEITGTVDTKTTAYTRPELSGTVSRQNATVDVKIVDDVYRATNNRDGSWTLPKDTMNALADGTYDVELTFSDGSLEGSDTTTDELTIDTAAPLGTFTRIVTEDTSPRIHGTVDTSSTQVHVEVEGKVYEATVQSNNRWVIAKGTISPNLKPGTYTAILYLQRNDKEAMETVRRAITVQSNDDTSQPQPPDDNTSTITDPTGSDTGTGTPEQNSTASTGTNETSKRKKNSKTSSNDSSDTTHQDSDRPTTTRDEDEQDDPESPLTTLYIAAGAICTVAALAGSSIFLIGWKRKHKKDEEELI